MKNNPPHVQPSGATVGVQRPSVPVKDTKPDNARTGLHGRFVDTEPFLTAVIRLARGGGLRRRLTAVAAVAITAALVLGGGVGGMPTARAAGQPPVGLGTAASFAVLAGQTVTNTGPTVISGNVGVSPGSAVTNFPPGTVSHGQVYTAGTITNRAQADLTTAYNDAAGRTPATTVGALSGKTLAPGVYKTTSGMSLTGTVTLDAYGNPNAVFIFQAGSTLITASHSTVQLSGGAQACNVFWQVGSSATLGTNTTFAGSILALTSVTVNTGTTVAGRVLARNGQVSLDSNTITVPTCQASTTSSSTTIATAPSSHAITLGQSVHDVATVAGNTTKGTPTGSVQFYACGAGSTTCTPSSGTALTPVEPLSGGVATSSPFTPSATGTYCFAAVYTPSGSTYAASSETGTPTNGECVTVTASATPPPSTTITTAPSSHAITLGQSVHDVATVAGNTANGTPTGSVQFYVCGAGSTTCTPSSGTALTPVEPLSGGVATSSPFTPSASGTYCFAAVYTPSGSTYAASSQAGTPTNGECFTVTASGTAPRHTTPPAVVPSTHTGKPWSGWLYWLLVAATGATGVVLVTDRASRRHSSRRLGR